MMREHHPMRYNRMTEIIKAVAQGLFEFNYFILKFQPQTLPLFFPKPMNDFWSELKFKQ